MHVLIIEDETLLALDLQMFVEDQGAMSCSLAETEAGAIAEASRQRPDIILSDVNLAQGNGPDAVRAIRSALGDIPVVYITGNPRQAQQADPGTPVIVKPVLWPDLSVVLQGFGLHREAVREAPSDVACDA